MTRSALPVLGDLVVLPAADRPDLFAPSVVAALTGWEHLDSAGVVEIDPEHSDTAAMCAEHDLPTTSGGNCVLVAGKREGVERVAACVVRADHRADVNGAVKRALDVRKASFLDLDRAVAESGMEYGGITPVGLPQTWRVWIDEALLEEPVVVLGSGVRRGKLLLPGALLAELPGASVLPDLVR